MQKKHQMKYFTMLLLVFCLGTTLVSPGLSAQTGQKGDPPPTTQVSPKDVTIRTVDLETYQAEALAAQQDKDISWVHGSSIHLELEEPPFTLTHFGFASEVTIIQTSAGAGNWVHFAIPTATFVLGAQARLNRVIIFFDSPPNDGAGIDRVDVWDGANRLLSMPVLFGQAGLEAKSIEFPAPPSVFTGVGISIHILNCSTPEFCSTRKIRFVAAGAAFAR